MSSDADWLPPLISLEDHGGDWDRYIDAIYGQFYLAFVQSKPTFEGTACRIDSRWSNGKESTFWHLTSMGSDESARIPDLRRCERICWPRKMIDAVGTDRVKWWRNTRRKNEERVVIALPDFSYVVILVKRRSYYMLWTAYTVEEEYRRLNLKAEFEKFEKN